MERNTLSASANLVLRWFDESGQDLERTARYMRDVIRIGGIVDCRALIRSAMVEGYGEEYVRIWESGRKAGLAESDQWHSAIFSPVKP